MTDRPGHVADRPGAEDEAFATFPVDERHDLLSELLGSVRLRGERIAAYAPPASFTIAFAGSGTLHLIEQGELQLALGGEDRGVRLSRGDLVLLPRGDNHVLSEAPREPAHKSQRDGVPARWLCGTFTMGDPRASHLLASLPPVITLLGARDQSLEWLEVSRRMLLKEMQSPSQGSVVMVARILDLLFIQVLRAWAASDLAAPSWLTGALDAQIGTALATIHGDPAENWTVERLARGSNLSRSAFAARFATRVGKPPASYLAEVRLEAAADLLRRTSEPVAAVAARIGYTSEAAFSRAFKKLYGIPPARWRKNSHSP